MTTATITQNIDSDFSAIAAAAGVTLPLLSDFDLIPTPGLVGFYDLAELTGSTLADKWGINNLPIVGTPVWSSKGLVLPGGAVNRITTPFPITSDFEIVILGKNESGIATGQWQVLVGPHLNNVRGVMLSYIASQNSGNGQVSAYQNAAGASNFIAAPASETFTDVWRIGSLSRASTGADANKIVQAWNGGTIYKSAALTGFVPGALPFVIGSNTGGTALGSDSGSGNPDNGWKGTIAAIAVYNRQLSVGERAAVMAYMAAVGALRGIALNAA